MNTTFSKYSFFMNAYFTKDASFMDTIFDEYAYFSNATFSMSVSFMNTDFGGYTSFSNATFDGDVYFRYATFEMKINFYNAQMNYPADFAGVTFKNNTVLKGLWNNILYLLVWGLTMGMVKLGKKIVTDFSNLNTITIINTSSNPYLKRHIDDEQWIESWRYPNWWGRVLFIIWELTSHCGRSIGLWAFWSLLFAVIFGLIYAPLSCPEWIPERIQEFLNWMNPKIYVDKFTYNHPIWTSIYFSIVTFTTLGFGDVQPENGAGLFWVGFEVILGYIMLGGLISIFANKLARRS